MRQEGMEEGGKPRLGPCRERAELGAGEAGCLPAPNLPPGMGMKSGLAFPGLFWYNHKESAEPLPGAAESGPEWQGNTMEIYKIGLDKGAAALIIRQTDRQTDRQTG